MTRGTLYDNRTCPDCRDDLLRAGFPNRSSISAFDMQATPYNAATSSDSFLPSSILSLLVAVLAQHFEVAQSVVPRIAVDVVDRQPIPALASLTPVPSPS
jgi:hypothetical protein